MWITAINKEPALRVGYNCTLSPLNHNVNFRMSRDSTLARIFGIFTGNNRYSLLKD